MVTWIVLNTSLSFNDALDLTMGQVYLIFKYKAEMNKEEIEQTEQAKLDYQKKQEFRKITGQNGRPKTTINSHR